MGKKKIAIKNPTILMKKHRSSSPSSWSSDEDELKDPSPAEPIASSSVSAYLILPFEASSPLSKCVEAMWKSVEAMSIFKRIPQKPHFKDLPKNGMHEGTALGLVLNYAFIADSIKNLSLNDDLTAYEEKLSCLDSLETHGFDVDPLRILLNNLLAVKRESSEKVSRASEKEKEVAERIEDNNYERSKVDNIDADLAEVKKRISELQEEENTLRVLRARCLEKSVENEDFISRINNEISLIIRDEEEARERFSNILKEPYEK